MAWADRVSMATEKRLPWGFTKNVTVLVSSISNNRLTALWPCCQLQKVQDAVGVCSTGVLGWVVNGQHAFI